MGLSRAKRQFKLFVNDNAKFAQAVARNTGEKTSALASIPNYIRDNKSLLPNTINKDKPTQSNERSRRSLIKTR